MANKKFDGLVESVRYAADGKIEFVRVFERRGATFSDQVLLDRAELAARLKKGQKFVIGARKELLASTFEPGVEILLTGDVISTQASASRDHLAGVPLL